MISSILFNNIYDLITRIGVVEEAQIYTMFGNTHGEETIRWCVKELLRKNKVNFDRERGIITRRQSVYENDFGQQLLTKATWLLAYMGDEKVREYMPVRYPSQMLIIGEDNTVYDITVYTWQTVQAVNMSIMTRRQAVIPYGVDDLIVHIAVVPDEEMAEQIKDFGFDNYCILDTDNKPQYFQWED